MVYRILRVGDAALLLELDSLSRTLELLQALQSFIHAGQPDAYPQTTVHATDLLEVVPAARTLLIRYKPAALDFATLKTWLTAFLRAHVNIGHSCASTSTSRRRVIEVPVHYDGADLTLLAQHLGISVAQLIDNHTAQEFSAAFAGFAPGFVYLSGGHACFRDIPRRASPRTRVPPGAVAVAGDFSAVYPAASPGGWQLLGTTPLSMWDPARVEPALIQPGDQVRFVDLARTAQTYSLPTSCLAAQAQAVAKPQVTNATSVAADVVVLQAGLQTLVQDGGRPGYTSMGVSRSGALDIRAMHLANRILGNPLASPVLEHALGGLQLQAKVACQLAVTGALAPVVLASASGMRLPAAANSVINMQPGDLLRLGRVRAGVRCYVAVAGGWEVPKVLGSCASDTLAGIGPAALKPLDGLKIAAAASHKVAPAYCQKAGQPAHERLPQAGDTLTFDLLLGPRDDWFTPTALELLSRQSWQVTPQSSRVGMRLRGAAPLVRQQHAELPSEGTVSGALQVPADGQPVIFLADHPLTGGYPVIGVVASSQIDLLAQVPVGARIVFKPI